MKLINMEKALSELCLSHKDIIYIDKNETAERIRKIPSIDIEPKRGEWIDKGWKGDWQFETDGRGNCWHEYECSECGFHNKGSKSNYCPNCGADMRERKESDR